MALISVVKLQPGTDWLSDHTDVDWLSSSLRRRYLENTEYSYSRGIQG